MLNLFKALGTENNDVDLGFETFFKLFSRTLRHKRSLQGD